MKWFHRKPKVAGGQDTMPAPPPTREWTFMVYLAGDNNLEEFGRSDLLEMKEVGSTPEVAIVAQFDQMSDGPTRRYYLTRGRILEEDEIGPPLGEINTGDPQELTRFMLWTMQTYPARRYALVLWNHGTGWKEDDIYHVARGAGIQASVRGRPIDPLVRGFAERAKRPPLFAPTIKSILARGIAYDDTSSDFLDNAEMQQAIQSALGVAHVEKLALLGFDACLMSMLEVAYQLRDVAQFVVGSQETEPGRGWPYGAILAELVKRPDQDTGALSSVIVEKYLASYGPLDSITQSALDLGHVQEVVAALNEMCDYVIQHQEDCQLAIARAGRRAQSYTDPDYKDLYDFCRLAFEHGPNALKLKAQAVMELLAPPGQGRFVLAEGHQGFRMGRSHGVSIYFPTHEISPFYGRLDFAGESLWDDMLRRLSSA